MDSMERYTFSVESKDTGGPVTFIGTATGIKHLAAVAGIEQVYPWQGFDHPVMDGLPVDDLETSKGDSSFVIALPRGKHKSLWYIEVPDRTIGVFDPDAKKLLYWHTSGNHDGLETLLSSLLRDMGHHPQDEDGGFRITPMSSGGRMTKFLYSDLSTLFAMVSAPFRLGHEVLLGTHSSFNNAGRYVPPRLSRSLVKGLSTKETPEGRVIMITCGTQEELHEFTFHSGEDPLRDNMRGEVDILMYEGSHS